MTQCTRYQDCKTDCVFDEVKKSYLLNDKRIANSQSRFASGSLSRIDFLRAVSHNLRSTIIEENDGEEDTGENDDTDEDTNNVVDQMNTGVSATQEAVPEVPDTDAVIPDACEVCLLQQRSHQAFVPCGHSRLCESCVNHILQSGSSCPICRASISMTINIY